MKLLFFAIALGVVATACSDVGSGGAAATSATGEHAPVRQTAEALHTPTPTPVPPVGPDCPVDNVVCLAAQGVAAAAKSGHLDSVPELVGQGLEVVCSPVAIQTLLPVCENAEGQTRSGFATAVKRLAFITRDDFLSFLAVHLSPTIGGTATSLTPTAVGCARANEQASLDCSTWAAAAFGPAEPEGVPVIVLFRRTASGITAVGAYYFPSIYRNGGGWAGLPNDGANLPARLWFVPWTP